MGTQFLGDDYKPSEKDVFSDFEQSAASEGILESITDTYFTDLICEGPIDGFCDQDGNIISPNFIDDSSGLTNEQIEEHNKTEAEKYLKAFYVNGVPLMDSDDKINFDKILFDFSIDGKPKVPGSSMHAPEFYRPHLIYRKGEKLIGARPGTTNYGQNNTSNYLPVYGDQLSSPASKNFYNAAETAKSKGAIPSLHYVENNWVNNLILSFNIPALFAQGPQKNYPYALFLSIRVKNEGEEWQNVFQYDLTQSAYTDGNRLEILGYPKENVFASAGSNAGGQVGGEILTVHGLATSPVMIDVPITLPENPRGVRRIIEVVKISQERFPNKRHWDSEGNAIADPNLGDNCGVAIKSDAILDSVVEINPFKFSYPNSVVIASKYSSSSFSSAPERSWHLRLKKVQVPSNYNPETREYNGFWDGSFSENLKWTDNPAWIFYDIVINPVYGLGKFNITPSNIDKFTLYKIAKYCDELVRTGYDGLYQTRDFEVSSGQRTITIDNVTQDEYDREFLPYVGKKLSLFEKSDESKNEQVAIIETSFNSGQVSITVNKLLTSGITGKCAIEVSADYKVLEPRFSCNAYLTQREDALKVLTDFASIFRGMMYWINGQIVMTYDSPKDPSMTFTNANVLGGRFEYSGTAKTAKFSVAKVSYIDSQDNFSRKIEYVEDTDSLIKFGYLEKEMGAFGCSSRGQAHRLAKWLLYSSRFESEVVSFKTGIEGGILRPGNIIKIVDRNRALTRLGGRTKRIDVENRKIHLDSEISEAINGGTVTIINPKGNESQESLHLKGGVSDRDIENLSAPQIFELNIDSIDRDGKVLTVSLKSEDSNKDIEYILKNCPAGSVWIVEIDTDETSYVAKEYRILGVSEESSTEFNVLASEYSREKFSALEKDIVFEREILPASNKEPQFFINQLPDPPTSPLVLTRSYDATNQDAAIISGDWSAPANLPLDSNGNEVESVDYVVDYYYKGNFRERRRVPGRAGVSDYFDVFNVGKDYGFYSVNVFSEYNGVKSRNYISESINIPVSGVFNGYQIVDQTFSQNPIATTGNPAGAGVTGEFSERFTEFSWRVEDNRIPGVYLDANDLFYNTKYEEEKVKHFNLNLYNGDDTLIQSVSNLKDTKYTFDLGSANLQGNRTAYLEIESVAPSGLGEVTATGYITGKNYAPQIDSFSYDINGRIVSLGASVSDSDFTNISVYRTGLTDSEELTGGDFAISNDLLVYPRDEQQIFVNTGEFNQERNVVYYYKMVPNDSFGTGEAKLITDAAGNPVSFGQRLDIANLNYSVAENGDMLFTWDVVNSIGENVDIRKYSSDIDLGGFLIKLRDDDNDIEPNLKTLDTIRFTRDLSDPTKIDVSFSDNVDSNGSIKEAFKTFYRRGVEYNELLSTEENQFVLTNFLSGGSSIDGTVSAEVSNRITVHNNSLGKRAASYQLDTSLSLDVLSGDILYTRKIPRTFVPEDVGKTSYLYKRSENNEIYYGVHNGGYKTTTTIDGDERNKTISKSALVSGSGKRSVDFEVQLVDTSFNAITSGRTTGIDPHPYTEGSITFDPTTSPGNVIFHNIDYQPGLEEKSIKKVDVYTGSAGSTPDLTQENFAFSIQGAFGGSTEKPTSSVTPSPNVIVHYNVPHDELRSKPYAYRFLPYDTFGSGQASAAIDAYVINPKRIYDDFDFTPPTEVSSLVVDGGFGDKFSLKWTDSYADDESDETNKDIDYYEIWKADQVAIGSPQNSILQSGSSETYDNTNGFVHFTANDTGLVTNGDPSTGINNASIVATTKDRAYISENTGDLGWFWIRTVDKRGNKSRFYPDGSGSYNFDRAVPQPPTELSVQSAFDHYFLSWQPSPTFDVKSYEIWKSPLDILESGNSPVADNSINTGISYLDENNNVLGDPWTTGNQELIATVAKDSLNMSVTGVRQSTNYFWIRAVDKAGNKSKFANSVTGIGGTLGTIESTDIKNFAIDASKTFMNIPVLSGDVWTSDSPTPGSSISWNNHEVVYGGVIHYITADNTANSFVYWQSGNNYYTSSNDHSGALMDDNTFIIATNTSGSHDLAWNAVANQVIGSAYIQDAAIVNAKIANLAVDNAKIADLSVGKLTAGIMSGHEFTLASGDGVQGTIKSEDFDAAQSGFALTGNGFVHFKTSESSFKFTEQGIELVGTLINSTRSQNLTGSQYIPTPGAPVATFVGGGYNNSIDTIGTGNAFGTAIVAGAENRIAGRYSFIGGGIANSGWDHLSFIGGGWYNYLGSGVNEEDANYEGANVIVGGQYNRIDCGARVFIGGGRGNWSMNSRCSVINGGEWNLISGDSHVSVVGGGVGNCTIDDSCYSNVVGGYYNTLEGAKYSSIVGGCGNSAEANLSFIGGGSFNQISNTFAYNSVIAGGAYNTLSSASESSFIGGGCLNTGVGASFSFIGGGESNLITSSSYSSILGGYSGQISSSDMSVVFGHNVLASAGSGNLVFGDYDTSRGQLSNHASSNSATFRFCNGAKFQDTFVCSDVKVEAPTICGTTLVQGNTVCAQDLLRVGTGAANEHQPGSDFNGICISPFYTTGGWNSSHIDLWGGYQGFGVQPGTVTYHSHCQHKFFGGSTSRLDEGTLIACISHDAGAGFTGIYSNYDIVSCSDARGKYEVQGITSALDKVNRLCGRTYCTNGVQGRTYGLIAQEVAEVVPEIAYSGNSGENYGLKYMNTIPILIEAIKEQNRVIQDLEARLS